MRGLVVYDSVYGNTEKIAEAISSGIAISNEVETLHVKRVDHKAIKSFDLLVVGSPTHGGRPTPDVQAFLNKIGESALYGVQVAAFDTRFSAKDQNIGLRFLMRAIGYAADKIARKLKALGGQLVLSAEGFIVIDREGPLKEGELERAAEWGKSINTAVQSLLGEAVAK